MACSGGRFIYYLFFIFYLEMGGRGLTRKWRIENDTAHIVLAISKMGNQHILTLPKKFMEDFGLTHGDLLYLVIKKVKI